MQYISLVCFYVLYRWLCVGQYVVFKVILVHHLPTNNGFYSPFYIFYMRSFDNFLSKVKFSWLYFSTMHILWDRPSQYDVLLIIHATKVLKSLVYDSWLQVSFVAFRSWQVKHHTEMASSQDIYNTHTDQKLKYLFIYFLLFF